MNGTPGVEGRVAEAGSGPEGKGTGWGRGCTQLSEATGQGNMPPGIPDSMD